MFPNQILTTSEFSTLTLLTLECFPVRPPTSLLQSISDCKRLKRTIAGLYEKLHPQNLMPLDIQTDLDEQITDDIWPKIESTFPSSICLRHDVIQFKIGHQSQWSKVRPSKIRPDLDPISDRCGRDPATLLHMFRACPMILTFCQSIFATFSKIFGKGSNAVSIYYIVWCSSIKFPTWYKGKYDASFLTP